MPLSCSCALAYVHEPGSWVYWYQYIDFEKLETKKRKRCTSCGELIDIGSFCLIFPRYRYPWNEIESRIAGVQWGDLEEPTIRIADHYHCEKCGEIYLNLDSVGFECISPNEDMQYLLAEYKNTYNPPKIEKNM